MWKKIIPFDNLLKQCVIRLLTFIVYTFIDLYSHTDTTRGFPGSGQEPYKSCLDLAFQVLFAYGICIPTSIKYLHKKYIYNVITF